MSGPGARPRDVGSSLPVAALVAGLVFVLVLISGFGLWGSLRRSGRPRTLVLATGPEGGAYHSLGVALAPLIEERGLAKEVHVQATEGSGENMRLLDSGAADLAIVQSDSEVVESVRLVATLFNEALHILVTPDLASRASGIVDIDGRRVSLGESTSGTRQVAARVLAHFDVEPSEDLHLPPAEALAGLEAGRIDAVCLLTAVPSVGISAAVDGGGARFLSLGNAQELGAEADGLALVFPQLHTTIIPRGTYGRLPVDPVKTVGVRAQLVGRAELDDALVHELLGVVFAQRYRLNDTPHELSFGDHLRETYVPGAARLPYHPGAAAYYERFRPSFVVEYAEPMSLALTLLIGVWSGSVALRQWVRRRRKNRVDLYYIEVVKGAPNLSAAGPEELMERREQLIRVRERAFIDLVAERLEADESFVILQNHIDSELASIQRRLARSAPVDPEAG